MTAVEALGTFSEWANGPVGKENAEYVGRLSQVEAVVTKSLAGMARGEEPPAAIGAALSCFREAVRLWPRVTEVWTAGEQWVREAAHALGIKSAVERRQDEESKQAELRRASRTGPVSPEVAIRNCKAAVLEELKAPATARFGSASYDPVQEWAVIGDVDAQNSYGALVRGTFGCKMDGVAVRHVTIATRR